MEHDRRASRCEHGKEKVGMCCVKDLEAQLAVALESEAALLVLLKEGIGMVDTMNHQDSSDPEKWEMRLRMLGVWKDQARRALADAEGK